MIIYGMIMAVVFGGLFAFWLHTPLFQHFKEDAKEQVRIKLAFNYWQLESKEREYYMKEYNLTYDDISIQNIMKQTSDNTDKLINQNPVLKFLLGY